MQHKLPDLPYATSALGPHMSRETLEFHHGKHHKAYVDKLNELVEGSRHERQTVEELIMSTEGALFNNAAQHWNHSFFWKCLAPKKGGFPHGKIGDLISARWGNFEKFKEAFAEEAIANFGSGWTWLVQHKGGEIDIFNTSNADTPMTAGFKALLTVDVWEHAYYIDYRNARQDYLANFWKLVNWDFVNARLKAASDLPLTQS